MSNKYLVSIEYKEFTQSKLIKSTAKFSSVIRQLEDFSSTMSNAVIRVVQLNDHENGYNTARVQHGFDTIKSKIKDAQLTPYPALSSSIFCDLRPDY